MGRSEGEVGAGCGREELIFLAPGGRAGKGFPAQAGRGARPAAGQSGSREGGEGRGRDGRSLISNSRLEPAGRRRAPQLQSESDSAAGPAPAPAATLYGTGIDINSDCPGLSLVIISGATGRARHNQERASRSKIQEIESNHHCHESYDES